MEAVYANKITTAQAQRDYLLKKAIYDEVRILLPFRPAIDHFRGKQTMMLE